MILFSFLASCLYSNATFAQQLDGRWVSNCWQLPKRHSIKTFLEFKGSKASTVLFLYSDSNCQSLNLSLVSQSSFSKSATGEFDYTPQSVELTLLRDDIVEYYNNNLAAACGLNSWEFNRPKNVSGRVCSGREMPELNKMTYDLFEISNNKLFFATFSISNGSQDILKRPTKVNLDVFYQREP